MGIFNQKSPTQELQDQSYLQEEQPVKGGGIFGTLGPGGGARAGQGGAKDQSLYDVTVGAFEFGAADTAALLTKNIGSTIGSDYVLSVAKDLEQFKKDNPQYAPTEVRSTFDLVTNPAAISSRVFGAAPYMLATLGATALPGGFPLAMALTYGIESQRAYDEAVQDGASEGEANTSARISGVVNSLLQSGKVAGILSFGKDASQRLAKEVVADAAKLVKSTGAVGEAVNFVTKQAVIGSLQGASAELIPLGVYAKPVQGDLGDFIDRRLQDAFGAVTTALVFGPAEKAWNSVVQKNGRTGPVPEGEEGKVVDSFDRRTLYNSLVNTRGVEPVHAEGLSNLIDAQARKWAQDNGRTKAEFYSENAYVKALVGEEVKVPTKTESGAGQEGEKPDPSSSSQNLLETGDALVKGLKVDLQGTGKEKKGETSSGEGDLLEKLRTSMGGGKVQKEVDNLIFGAEYTGEALTKKLGVQDLQPLVDKGLVETTGTGTYTLNRSKFEAGGKDGLKSSPRKLDPEEVRSVIEDVQKVFFSTLPSDKLDQLRKMYPGKGKVSGEEQLSQAFEKYLRSGQAPSSELVETFQRFRGWMKETWASVRDQGLKTKLSPEAVRTFDSVLMAETPTVEFLGKQTEWLGQKVEILKKQKATPEVVKAAQDEFKQSQRDWQSLKEAQFTLREKTEVELSAERAQEKMKNEPPVTREYRTKTQTLADSVMKFLSLESPLKRYGAGKETLDALDNFTARTRSHIGKWEDRIVEAYSALTSKDRQWMAEVDATGTTNFQKAYDAPTTRSYLSPGGTGIDPSTLPPSIQAFGKLLFDINRYSADLAKEVGVVQKRADGSVVPFEQPDGQRIPRNLTMDAKSAVLNKSGPIYDALVDSVSKLNNITPEKTKSLLEQDFGRPDVRRSSSLEYTRKIKSLPAVVMVNGEPVAIQHIEPLALARRSLENQTKRAEFIREFGQGLMDQVGRGDLKKLAEILGADYKVTKEKLRTALEEKLGTVAPDLKINELRDLAKDSGVDLNWSNSKFVDEIFRVPFTDLGKRQEAKIRRLAKDVGGVTLEAKNAQGVVEPRPLVEVFNDLKQRLVTPLDNKAERLARRYVEEGGNLKDFQDVMTVAQGLPFHFLGRSKPEQVAKFSSQVIGSLQTSLAAIPNLTQVLVQVPQLAGLKNTVMAIDSYIKNPKSVASDITSLGGLHRSVFVTQAEPGYRLENAGKVLQEVVSRTTFQDQINDFNRFVAGEAFRLKALEWKKGNFSQADVYTAKFLGLKEPEVTRLLKGEGMDDLTFSKVVQNGIGRTQFQSDAAYKKGLVENIPLARMVMSYSSYLFGTTRANLALLTDAKTAIKGKDLKGVGDAAQRLSYLLVGMVGAGMTSQILRAAVKGKGSDEVKDVEDTLLQQTLGALHEVGGLGILQRFTDAFKFDGDIPEKTALGMAPQVGAIVKFMGVLAGYGRFGEFPLSERLAQEAKRQTPAAGATSEWFNDLAWPQEKTYDIVKGQVTEWKKKNLPKQEGSFADTPMRPDYWNIFKRVQRGDVEDAVGEAKKFYLSLGQKGKDPELELRGLRASLLARSPLNLGDLNEVRFLSSLPVEKRVQALKAQVQYQAIVDTVAPRMGQD